MVREVVLREMVVAEMVVAEMEVRGCLTPLKAAVEYFPKNFSDTMPETSMKAKSKAYKVLNSPCYPTSLYFLSTLPNNSKIAKLKNIC